MIKADKIQERLENYINQMDEDLVSVIPDVCPTFQGMGATEKIDFILFVEKLKVN